MLLGEFASLPRPSRNADPTSLENPGLDVSNRDRLYTRDG